MDINDVIDWLGSRDDIVIADKDKFIADMREKFNEHDFSGFLDEAKYYGRMLVEKHTAPGKKNHILLIATDEESTTGQWGGSITGLSNAFLSSAVEDDDYVTLVEEIYKNILMLKLSKLFGHDTD